MSDAPLSESERGELERLRAKAGVPPAVPSARPGRGRNSARWIASLIALVLAALVAAASILVGYARDELLDTERYVQTVAPLAKNPAIQAAVAAQISSAINKELDIRSFVDEAIEAIETEGGPEALEDLVGPITSALESFVAAQVDNFVRSDRFAQLWEQVNAAAHREVDALLEGRSTELLTLKGDTLYLELGPVIEQVKDRLVDRGLTIAEDLPAIELQFRLMEVRGLADAQGLTSLLDTLAWALPVAALVLFGVGVYAAPNRRRALVIGALMVAAATVVLLIAVAVGRTVALDRLPSEVSLQAAAAAFDIVVRFLISAAESLLTLAVIVAVVAWLAGPGRVASAIRGGFRSGRDAMASALDRTGLPMGGAARFTARHLQAMKVAVVVLALAWALWLEDPGVEGVLWVALAAVLAVAILEVLARTSPASAKVEPT